ncbi:hypothetical protein Dimus_029750 [Dionaea muscipula]
MGCSASRLDILHIKTTTTPTEEPPPSCASSFHSPAAKSPPVAKTRSLAAPFVHHFPLRKGDSHHLVSLTSTTYGSLADNAIGRDSSDQSHGNSEALEGDSKDPSSSPDSVINTWELMEGLDDNDDDDDNFNVDSSVSAKVNPSNSFHFSDAQKVPSLRSDLDSNGSAANCSVEKELDCNGNLNSKPLWKYLSEESLLSKMDPNVASSYRRALSSRQLGHGRLRVAKSTVSSPTPLISTLSRVKSKKPNWEDRIVLYFTSLRGIRRTYEDCCAVRMIFRGFRVHVDERDISMDSMYRKELQSALGGKTMIALPQVFIRGNPIGGAEEIKRLHELGELAKLLIGFPVQDYCFTCDTCGDARFLPCPCCNGSKKVFVEEEARLRRCPDCNENGLIRCPACCS